MSDFSKLEISPEQSAEMRRLKGLAPFRIVWGCFDRTTGEWGCWASLTRRPLNKAVREGHKVYALEPEKKKKGKRP